MNVLTIPSRFNGPAGVGNGGYVCGRIAAYVDGPATVTLRRPPPLDTPLEVERDDEGSVRVRHGRTLIGEAAPSPASPHEITGPAEAGWDTAILLGRMTAVTLAPRPAVGDRCRVIAWPQTRDGRKLTAGSALLGPGGEVLALAEAVWLTVPRPGPAPGQAAEVVMVAGGAP